MLPPSCFESPEVLIDCLAWILKQANPGNLDMEYHKYYRVHAPVLRSGILLLNFVGRCNFKYIVKFTLDKYRQLVLDQPINPYENVLRRIGYSKSMLSLTTNDMAESAQLMR